MKKEVKFFILGCLANMLAIGIIAGIVVLVGLIKDKIEDAKLSSSSSSSKTNKVVIGDYEYRDDNLYISENGYREYEDIECSALNDIAVNNIRTTENMTFITNNGELYQLNSYKKFSDTNSNCRKVSDAKLRGMYQHLFVGTDSTLYELRYNEDSPIGYLEAESANYTNIRIFKKDINASDVVMVQQLKSKYQDNKTIYTYLVLKSDGVLYSYEIEYLDMTGSSRKLSEEVYFKKDGEKVKYFSIYDGKQGGILTDKGVYVSVLSVADCKTFADVECEYKFEKEEYFSKYVDDIKYAIYVSGSDDSAGIGYYNKEGKYISISKRLNN